MLDLTPTNNQPSGKSWRSATSRPLFGLYIMIFIPIFFFFFTNVVTFSGNARNAPARLPSFSSTQLSKLSVEQRKMRLKQNLLPNPNQNIAKGTFYWRRNRSNIWCLNFERKKNHSLLLSRDVEAAGLNKCRFQNVVQKPVAIHLPSGSVSTASTSLVWTLGCIFTYIRPISSIHYLKDLNGKNRRSSLRPGFIKKLPRRQQPQQQTGANWLRPILPWKISWRICWKEIARNPWLLRDTIPRDSISITPTIPVSLSLFVENLSVVVVVYIIILYWRWSRPRDLSFPETEMPL